MASGNFSALPDWFIDNYDVFRGRVRELKLSAASTFVLSNSYNQMYMMFYWNPIDDEEPIKVTFEINLQEKHPKLEERKNITIKWLSKQGYKNPTQDGKVQKIAVNVNNIDDVITLWNEFWS